MRTLAEILSKQGGPVPVWFFVINLALAVLLSLLLAHVYTRWGDSLSNRRRFSANFVLITVTTTFIISIIQSSLALSLGLVGALSIVRFRAAIKEPEELAYLFVAISVGLGWAPTNHVTLLPWRWWCWWCGAQSCYATSWGDLHVTVANHTRRGKPGGVGRALKPTANSRTGAL